MAVAAAVCGALIFARTQTSLENAQTAGMPAPDRSMIERKAATIQFAAAAPLAHEAAPSQEPSHRSR